MGWMPTHARLQLSQEVTLDFQKAWQTVLLATIQITTSKFF